MLPRHVRGKPASLVAACILAGCGGAGKIEAQTVRGPGFSFQAPGGWSVARSGGATAAVDGPVDRVEVRTFPLARRYEPELFQAVVHELDEVAARLARQLSGKVTGRETLEVAGRDARAYRIEYGERTQEITFVLSGKREYQLLCRRLSGGSDEACRLLVTSFALR